MASPIVKLGKELTEMLTKAEAKPPAKLAAETPQPIKKAKASKTPTVQMASPEEAIRMKEVEDLMAQDKISEAWDRYEALFQESSKTPGATRPWLHDLGNRMQTAIFDGYSRGLDIQKPKSLEGKK